MRITFAATFIVLLVVMTTSVVSAQTTAPHTLADLTGDGSVHPVSATALLVKTADLTALANSAACRIGDINISLATRGQIIAAGGSYHFGTLPAIVTGPDLQKWDLSKVYYVCSSGDKLTVQYSQ